MKELNENQREEFIEASRALSAYYDKKAQEVIELHKKGLIAWQEAGKMLDKLSTDEKRAIFAIRAIYC